MSCVWKGSPAEPTAAGVFHFSPAAEVCAPEGFTVLCAGRAARTITPGEQKMATSVWKGSISFGLLSIPIRLYPAARPERVNLHQLHKKDHTRLRQPFYCPTDRRIVDRSEVVKGYEYEKDHYVLIEDDELKKITPPSGRTMEIDGFVEASQIDPIFFESSYFALPEKDNSKPYILLVKALEGSGRVGIAKVTMHQREYTVFIRPRNNGLTIHTMHFVNEIRSVEGYGKLGQDVKLKPQEIKLAEQLVESLSEDFKPQQYHDTFQENLKNLIEAKREGKSIVEEAPPKRAQVIDMMEALKRSLRDSDAHRQKKPLHARPTRPRKRIVA
jgi:DNA end-binding protein Ku